jgi:microcin C transport system substrate-binding protein
VEILQTPDDRRIQQQSLETPEVTQKVIRCLLLLGLLISTAALAGKPSHGFAYFGTLKYPADMPHFDYVNPKAPKDGIVRWPVPGTFNNLNSYVDKGILEIHVGRFVLEPLMRASEDELASYYGRLAETVEVADDYSWVQFTLRDIARWHDGKSVTVEDVIWTLETIKRDGSPARKYGLNDIVRAEKTGARSFKFHFAASADKNPQLIIQAAQFQPLPKHFWETRKINATTLEPPLGNGPYRVAEVDAGRRIVFERVEDYWARDLNISVGHNNFERLEIMYFFDTNVMLQALRAGVFDYYREQIESNLATAYDFSGYHEGLFKKETYAMGNSFGMHFSVVLNQRRALFKDIRLREALTLAYNFEWANRTYWHSGLTRNISYFARSTMQATGLPSPEELAVLEPFRDQVPPRVFSHPVGLPPGNPEGRNRENLIRADALLKAAGWVIKDFNRVHHKTGAPLTLEFIVHSIDHEQMLVPFVDNLKRLGINAVLSKVESNLLMNRMRRYDYDAIIQKVYTFNIPYPSNLRSQFTSAYADPENMRNYPGIKNPVVDALVEQVIQARTEMQMQTAGRALDRVLLWNFYVIPDGHPLGRHLVYWDRFGHPPLGAEHMKWTGFPYLWWFDAEKSARVAAGLSTIEK